MADLIIPQHNLLIMQETTIDRKGLEILLQMNSFTEIFDLKSAICKDFKGKF